MPAWLVQKKFPTCEVAYITILNEHVIFHPGGLLGGGETEGSFKFSTDLSFWSGMLSKPSRLRPTSETGMDEYLHSLGLWRKMIPKDGRSLYRAVAEQVWTTQLVFLPVILSSITALIRPSQISHYPLAQMVNKYLDTAVEVSGFQCDTGIWKPLQR